MNTSRPFALTDWPVPIPRQWTKLVNTPQTESEQDAVRRAIKRGSPFAGLYGENVGWFATQLVLFSWGRVTGGTLVQFRSPVRHASEEWNSKTIEAADFPIFDAVEFPTYSSSRAITYTSRQDWDGIQYLHREWLENRGWTLANSRDSNRLEFRNSVLSITIEGNSGPTGTTISVSRRLNWYKTVPTETPQLISYEAWRRREGLYHSLGLIDIFRSEMDAVAE